MGNAHVIKTSVFIAKWQVCLSYGLHFSGLSRISLLLKTLCGEHLAVFISNTTIKSHLSGVIHATDFFVVFHTSHSFEIWHITCSLSPDAEPSMQLPEFERIFKSEHLAWGSGLEMRGSDGKRRETGGDLAGQKPY